MKEKIQNEYLKTEISIYESETSGDFILPDSYPDVKNILSSNAYISEVNKYAGSSEFEVSGNLVYNIMFTAAGDDGEVICSVSFTDNFKCQYKYKSPTNTSGGMQTKLTDISCRMANPRKFSVKAYLESILYENISCQAYPEIIGDDTSMEYRYGEATALRLKNVIIDEHSYSDNIEIDIKLPEIEKIIHYDARLKIKDERSTDNAQTAKLGGIFDVTVIYKDCDGRYNTVKRDLPFGVSLNKDELMTIGEVSADTLFIPSVSVSALNINVGKNQYGENKVIELDADYDIDLMILSSDKISYVTDAYSTVYSCDCKYKNETIVSPVKRIKNNFTFSDKKDSGELLTGTAEILCAFPKATDVKAVKQNEVNDISGRITERVIIVSDNGMRPVDIVSGFTYKAGNSDKAEGIIGNTVISDNRVRCDSENLYIDLEAYLDYLITEKNEERLCTELTLSEREKKADAALFCIYYPAADDTLWDTAKRMKTTTEKICELNGISEGSPFVSPIIIE
jgi:hypothetical protein